ncbi:MAG: TM2 domain-containing protein [Deltaproteobacteria bacterium]|jgi:TM2 domain-containing membrane protein YozV|nr:TM2 domain-containing protein [Deltaproteobacteria bacterium]
MPTCANCGLNFPDGLAACPSCGIPVQSLPPQTSMNMPTQGHPQRQYGYPQGQMPSFTPGPSSPLNMSAVSVLCFYFGWLGVHRFYMGKIGSGILMLLTFGGLGLWSFIDIVLAACGRFHDNNGLPINVSRPINSVLLLLPILIFIFICFFIVGPAITIPQYAKYRQKQLDTQVIHAYYRVRYAEEHYWQNHFFYTDDYNELENYTGLIRDPEVTYGPIRLYISDTDPVRDCFAFKVKTKELPYGYLYSSCDETLKKY